MVLRALASPLPIAWVTADSAYGQDNRFRRLLEQSGVGLRTGSPQVPVQRGLFTDRGSVRAGPGRSVGEDLLRRRREGPRVYHWAAVRLPAVAEFDYQGEVPHRMRWALARRSISKPDEIAYYPACRALPPHLSGHRRRHHALSWSNWRRQRQAVARRCHYLRRCRTIEERSP